MSCALEVEVKGAPEDTRRKLTTGVSEYDCWMTEGQAERNFPENVYFVGAGFVQFEQAKDRRAVFIRPSRVEAVL